MRATHSVEDIFGSRGRVRVLNVLSNVDVPLNAARIARLASMSKPATAAVLEHLAAIGLVDREPAGQSTVYWLVRDNIYVNEIVQPAFRSEQEIPGMLIRDLEEAFGKGSVSVILHGSYARGEQGPGSDIDVVLVAQDGAAKSSLEEDADAAFTRFRKRYGATLSVIVYEVDEASSLTERAPALLESLRTEGIVVSGSAPWQWGSGER